MRRLLLGVSAALAALVLGATGLVGGGGHRASAQVQPPAVITLLQALPNVVTDMVVDDQVVVRGLAPGQLQDLSAFSGRTLHKVVFQAASSPQVVIGPLADIALPVSGNVTLVARLGPDGAPSLASYTNDMGPIPPGLARLTVRQLAVGPPVDLVVGPARPYTALAAGAEVTAMLPAGPITQIALAATGQAPTVPLPDMDLRAGEHLVLYTTGDWSKGNVVAYGQSLTGLGSAPSRVNTGDSPRSVATRTMPLGDLPVPSLPLVGGLVALLAVAAGALALSGRARVARRHHAALR